MGGVALLAGRVVWADLDPPVGREQGGRRPCVVISSSDFSDVITQLVIAVPCSTRDRGWINHIPVTGPTGLSQATFAITEQPRAMSVDRIHGLAGHVDDDCLIEIMRWVRAWQHPAS